MKVKIHTQGWVGSRSKDAGEEADASIHAVLEIDGMVIVNVTRIATICSNDGFTKVVATLIPGELETVVHDAASWKALVQDAAQPEGKTTRALYRDGLARHAADSDSRPSP